MEAAACAPQRERSPRHPPSRSPSPASANYQFRTGAGGSGRAGESGEERGVAGGGRRGRCGGGRRRTSGAASVQIGRAADLEEADRWSVGGRGGEGEGAVRSSSGEGGGGENGRGRRRRVGRPRRRCRSRSGDSASATKRRRRGSWDMERVLNYAMQGCGSNDESEEVEAAANASRGQQWMPSYPPYGMPAPGTPFFYPTPSPLRPPTGLPMQQFMEGPSVGVGDAADGKRGTKVKLSNFNPDEDVNLTKWWLAISTDPVNTGQRKAGFWFRITQGYSSTRGVYPERSQKSLSNHWDHMKECCTKFSEFYSSILRLNPSGMSDADKTTEAMSRYAAAMDKPFTLMHCWKYLKDEPKWQVCIVPQAKVAVVEDDCYETAAGGSNDVPSPGDTPSPADGGRKRLIGRDASKAARKKADTSSSSSEYVSQFNSMWSDRLSFMKESHAEMCRHCAEIAALEKAERRLALEERRLVLEESRMAKEKRVEEERILSIDLDTCKPALRLFYKRQQEEILAKYSLPPP